MDDYFQLLSSIPHFSYAQSTSFGLNSQSVTLNIDDLTHFPHLLVDSTTVFDTVTDSDSVAWSLNTDINSLDYFLAKSARRAGARGIHTRPGVVAWIKSPANTSGYLIYPEIAHMTNVLVWDYPKRTLTCCCS